MTFDRATPYNALPGLPPAVDLESKHILKAAIAANRALGELKGAGRNIPNQTVLLTVLGLQEAMSSSAIENVVTTNDQLYQAFAEGSGGEHDPATKEVLRYNHALWHGHAEVRRGRLLSTTLFEELVQTLKQTDLRVRSLPGTRVANAATKEIIYTPPEGSERIGVEVLAGTRETRDPEKPASGSRRLFRERALLRPSRALIQKDRATIFGVLRGHGGSINISSIRVNFCSEF